ncbi:hypothetical protein [Finegoldia magna]|uniref:hypothetical protein n=1 Tax=Finegoldia magna TaxID=1260 RepID=UPI00290549F4|nr:hypothetical protein [Finegoldia magna]MDU2500643.1 hypothetical protein [Finegoldia magna]
MSYDGKINRKLKLVSYDKSIFKRIPYKLQYENFKLYGNGYEKVLEYVQKYYINNNNIIEENLINDLNTFKTYRDDIQQEITMKSLIEIIWSVVVTMVSILVAIYIGYIALKDYIKIEGDNFLNFILKNIKIGTIIIMLISGVYLGLSINERFKHSKSYKLKYINNVIYTLETIKEDMDKTENLRAKYKATRNRYSPRAMYERKRR